MSSETGLFRHLFNDVFRSPSIQKHISYEGHTFLKKSLKLDLDSENAKKKKMKKSF